MPEPTLKEDGLYEIRDGKFYISEPTIEQRRLERSSTKENKVRLLRKSDVIQKKFDQIKRLSEEP